MGESRQGIDFENAEFRKIDKIVKKEIDKGHSFYMIVADHPELYTTTKKKVIYLVKILIYLEKLDIAKEKEQYLKTKVKEKKTNAELIVLTKTFLTIK